jgi:hypothetical protein
MSFRFGFAARCEARLRLAAARLFKFGLRPWFGLCPPNSTRNFRYGFAARCEARLRLAVARLFKFGLRPWFGLCPYNYQLRRQ